MKRRFASSIFILLTLLALTSSAIGIAPAYALTGGPDSYGYSYIDSNSAGGPAYNFQDISGTGTPVSLSDDSMSGAVPVGFAFNFYGNNYTEVDISSNGFITMLPGQPSSLTPVSLPNAAVPNGMIAGWWEDLFPPSGGTITYQTLGTEPDRVFIVQFTNIQHYGGGNPVTMQFQLFETSNWIEVHYQSAPSDGGSHAAGIEDAAGTAGLTYHLSADPLSAPLAVRYYTSISLSSNPWNFGSVNIGATSVKSFTLGNSTGADVNIGTLASNDAAFSLTADSCSGQTISTGGGCSFEVTFSPVSGGVYSGAITIPSDALGAPHTASLSGYGSDPNAPSMFVANWNSNTISRGNLDGTGGVNLGNLDGTLNCPRSIALDVVNNQMYVVNTCTGTISRSNLNGTGGVNLGNLDGTLNNAVSIALDLINDQMYIVNNGNATITRANLDGTGGVNLGNLNGTLNCPTDIALDVPNNSMYVTNACNNTVTRANLDGTGGASLGNFNGTVNNPLAIALDLANNHIYVANNGNSTVSRANLDGTDGVSLGNLGGLVCGPDSGLKLDVPNNKMYLSNACDNTVVQANLDGTGAVTLGNLNGTLNGAFGLALMLPPPAINFSPNTWDFGNQTIGTTGSAKSFTVTNVSGADINLGAISSSAGLDLLNDLCSNQSLPANGVCTFEVAFSPVAFGAYTGTISVPSDAPSSPDRLIVRGNGYSAPPVIDILSVLPAAPNLAATIALSDLEDDPLSGFIKIISSKGAPVSATFETLNTSCAGASLLTYSLNGVTIGTVAADTSCTCDATLVSNTVTGATLAANFNLAASNTWGYSSSGHTAWTRVSVLYADSTVQDACVVDYTGTNCTTMNLCAGNQVNVTGSSTLPSLDTELASQAYTNSVLPTSLDTSAIASGDYTLYAETTDGYSTTRDTEPFTLADEDLLNIALYNARVTFNANGGSGSMSAQIANAPTPLTLNTFTRAGYTFAGWATTANGAAEYEDGASYPFTANATLYAKWTANNNTITFNGNGATDGSTTAQTIATNATAPLTANGFTRTGYTFAGWATTAGGAVTYMDGANYTMGTANATLYAKWTADLHTVTYAHNPAGGTGTLPTQADVPTDGTFIIASDAGLTRADYTFAGWNDGTNTYAAGSTYTMGSSNVTLTAQWTTDQYTVTFDGNGATGGSMSPQTGAYNTTSALTLNAFTRTEHIFAGWNTASDGTGTPYADGADYIFTSDATLYAQWTKNSMTFYSEAANDGWVMESGENTTKGGRNPVVDYALRLGDHNQNRQNRAFVSFDTSSLPEGAMITSARLFIRKSNHGSGINPFTWGGKLRVDVKKGFFGTAPALVISDFQAPATKTNVGSTTFTSIGNNWYRVALTAAGRTSINTSGRTQFRLYFTNDDNNNIIMDYIRFYAGNATITSRPYLVIQYTLP